MNELFEKASALCMVQLHPVHQMKDGCWAATNSGGRKRYLPGYFHSGAVSVQDLGE